MPRLAERAQSAPATGADRWIEARELSDRRGKGIGITEVVVGKNHRGHS